jgi:hypothetical protein
MKGALIIVIVLACVIFSSVVGGLVWYFWKVPQDEETGPSPSPIGPSVPSPSPIGPSGTPGPIGTLPIFFKDSKLYISTLLYQNPIVNPLNFTHITINLNSSIFIFRISVYGGQPNIGETPIMHQFQGTPVNSLDNNISCAIPCNVIGLGKTTPFSVNDSLSFEFQNWNISSSVPSLSNMKFSFTQDGVGEYYIMFLDSTNVRFKNPSISEISGTYTINNDVITITTPGFGVGSMSFTFSETSNNYRIRGVSGTYYDKIPPGRILTPSSSPVSSIKTVIYSSGIIKKISGPTINDDNEGW